MSTERPPSRNARLALAAYLRLLAACLEDEAAMIEADGERGDDVLRRFREGVLALSLQDAPLDTLIAQSSGDEPQVAISGHAATTAATKRRR
jgi:hypothetical protein